MRNSASAKCRPFWRAGWFIGAAIAAAPFILWTSTGRLEAQERRFDDIAGSQSLRQPSDRIAVMAIDDQSLPTSVARSIYAQRQNMVHRAGFRRTGPGVPRAPGYDAAPLAGGAVGAFDKNAEINQPDVPGADPKE